LNKIEHLIQKLCPHGLEYKYLGEVCDIRNGYAFKKSSFHSGKTKVIRIGDIEPQINIKNFVGVYSTETPPEKYSASKNDILIGLTGQMGKIGKIIDEEIAYVNQRIAIIKASEHTNFIYHILCTNRFTTYLRSNAKKAIQTNISTKRIYNFTIPFPPIEIQKKITELLDDFEKSTNELIANMKHEIELRNHQYQYYRDKLLTFNTINEL